MRLIILTLFVAFFQAPSDPTEKITWTEDRKLSWEDFKGTPKGWDDYVASTSSGISFVYSVGVAQGELHLNYTVNSNFYPYSSWFVPEHASDYILRHEQTHFDISELHARIFRKRLAETEFSMNPKEKLDDMYAVIEEERRVMQKRYDNDTDHSQIPAAEERWVAWVTEQLEAYARWK